MDRAENTFLSKMKNLSPAIDRNYFWMLSGRMSPLLMLFVVTILYSHRLTLEDYSGFQSLWMYSNVVSVIIGFGVTTLIFSTPPGVLSGFFRRNRRQIISFYLLLWIVTLFIFFVAAKQFAQSLKLWIIIFIIVQTINSITESGLIKRDGSFPYFLINIVYSLFFFGWHIVILQSGYNLESLVKGIIGFSMLRFLALVSIKRSAAQYPKRNPEENKEFRFHWISNGINDILSVFSKWIDKLILVYLLVPADFAIFFNGSVEIPLFSIFINATGAYMMMQMAKSINDHGFIRDIFKENFLILSSAVFPLFFFLMFFREPVFLTFFGEKYLASLPVFAITILILPLRINHFGGILQVYGKGKIVTIGAFIDLILAIFFVFLLYPISGMQGAAAALVISTILQIVFYLFHISHTLKMSVQSLIPLKKLLFRFLLAGVIFGLLNFLVSGLKPILQIISGCILIAGYAFIFGRKYLTQFGNNL